jgi:steroid delta-isomerase-like uncharacterized protein
VPQAAPQPSPQRSPIDVAKAQVTAYNEKNWGAVEAALTADAVYDEVSTERRVQGVQDILAIWRGWATALPDSKATFHNALASGNTVVLELSWRGTHTGPLQTPTGTIAPSGKSVDLRACQIVELAGDKAQTIRQYFDMATLMRQIGAA